MSDDKRRTDDLSPLQRAALAIRSLQAEIEEMKKGSREPIAIVGIGCRFPGGVTDPDSYWQLLHEGRDAIGPVPTDRWDIDQFYDPTPSTRGKMYIREGGFVGEVDTFDCEFFGISPREANSLDPQHRMLLEVTWEALEKAGQAPSGLKGSHTGVFLGLSSCDYAQCMTRMCSLEEVDFYFMSGNPYNTAPGRISYILGLHGPTMAVDTACSSSLVAAHLACQSLRNGECDLALAGGVNLMLTAETVVLVCQAGMLSPSGRCNTFDESADGYGRGEGCGVVVLKRLSDALRDRNEVLAVISGSAVSHDGASSGFTVPHGPAQETVVRQALEAAGVEPAEIDYIEAHGTGTSLGDPIEIGALGRVFSGHTPEKPLIVGSTKTNIGHLEGAAGISGLIKIVLSLQHDEIPPHLNFHNPNPHIPWDRLPIHVPTSNLPWPSGDRVRRAGVSSFGVSGTISHMVVEEAPVLTQDQETVEARPRQLFVLSARSPAALQELAKRYREHLEFDPAGSLADICYTAAIGRSHFPCRLSTTAETTAELAETLASFAAGERVMAPAVGGGRAKPVFLFSGQGAQYPGMGRQLYDSEPTFRAALDRCDELLRPHLDSPLLSVLYPEKDAGDEALLHQTVYTQPALFALEYSLAQMWRSWGIEPVAVMGHSIGEYVAACIADVFSLEDGLRLIAHRGRMMQDLPQGGAMAAVFADREAVEEAVAGEPMVAIATVNGPENVVISGDRAGVETICAVLLERGLRSKLLRVSHAFHSPLMEPILSDFEQVAAEVSFAPPAIDLISNVTGALATDDIVTPGYWRQHVRRPVQFESSMKTLYDQGHRIIVELGPSTTLLGMGRQCLTDESITWAASLRRDHDDWQQVLECAGDLYEHGVEIDWQAFDRPHRSSLVDLPTYPFERQRHWIEALDRGGKETVGTVLPAGQDLENFAEELRQSGRLTNDEIEMLPRVLEVLAERAESAETVDVADLLYEVEWEPQALAPADDTEPVPTEKGRWLVFADSGGVAEALEATLGESGVDCSLVYPGESFKDRGDGSYELDPTRAADFDKLVSQTIEADSEAWSGVAHLWSLDATAADTTTVESLETDQQLGCWTALHLTQALVRADLAASLPVWYVTRGAQSCGANGPSPGLSQTTLWGLGRVIGLEHPEYWGGLLDLDAASKNGDAVSWLIGEFLAGDGEDQIAYRGDERIVARLTRSDQPIEGEAAPREEGTYLVTGGLGGLGVRVARRLVEKGAKSLVLVGRNGAATESAQRMVEFLQEEGASILVAKADVSDPRAMAKVIEQVRDSMPPLRGIVHAAGIATFHRLQDLDAEILAATLRPKVAGSWVLHELTRDLDLDFFVCFSSIAGVWGSGGHGHYAAANHFMDGFAHFRQDLGLPGISLSWGPWAGGGMATDQTREWLKKSGVEALAPELAMKVLEALLDTNCPHLTIARVDWQNFQELYEARGRKPLLDRVRVTTASGKQDGSVGDSILRLIAEDPSSRGRIIVDHLRQGIAGIMGHRDLQTLDVNRPLLEMGLDSLMAVEIRNLIAAAFAETVPVAVILEGASLQQLADQVENGLEGAGARETTEESLATEMPPEEAEQLLQNLDQLSDDEVTGLLGSLTKKEIESG